ncbi:MAG TPA: NADH-quinone oxidoreductase subunit NuoH [Chloroflexota bacterium]
MNLDQLIFLLVALVKAVVIFFALILGAAYGTLFERKILARIQFRSGPNRVGPKGLLYPLGDAVKMIFKEDSVPAGADKFVFWLAPGLSVMAAMMSFAVIPVGPDVNLFGLPVEMHLADVSVAVLYLMAVSSLGVYGIVLGGWSSNSKYSLLGSIRSSAQMISYELGMGLAILSLVLHVGSLRLTDIVNYQINVGWPLLVLQPIAFLVYIICAVAENNRAPFDLPEAEQELVAGYFTEYTGMKFAMFYLAEYVNIIIVSSVTTTLFLGGYHGPYMDGPWWFVAKVVALMFCIIWVRGTLPRMRYDKLMKLGWQFMIPVGLINLAITAIAVVLWA